jgi:hypothetical protein
MQIWAESGSIDSISPGAGGKARCKEDRQPVFQPKSNVDFAKLRRQCRTHVGIKMGDVDARAIGQIDLGAKFRLHRRFPRNKR